MGFSEIIGHRKQLETLRQGLANGRWHHAYLFVGPEGIGKRTVALSLAKAIHCAAGNGDFCGLCASCDRIGNDNHPDVRIIEPRAGKKEISIEQIRNLQKELNFRSFSGKKKIAVLDPATLINWTAQNALLKTLEEPPNESLLILIAPNAGGLLPTVRSRCLSVPFGYLPRELVKGVLLSKKGITAAEAELLAALYRGSLGSAVKADIKEMIERRRCWTDLWSSLSGGNYRAAINSAATLAGDKAESLEFLEWAESWYRDLLIYAVTQNPQHMVNVDRIATLQRETASADIEHLLSLISQIAGAAGRIQRNLNRRMVLERLLMDVVEGGG